VIWEEPPPAPMPEGPIDCAAESAAWVSEVCAEASPAKAITRGNPARPKMRKPTHDKIEQPQPRNDGHLRGLLEKDSELLLKWRNDPDTRRNSLHTEEVSPKITRDGSRI
jgi:hypothetical protein